MSQGSVTWNATWDAHAARVASRRSMELVAAKDKQGWLDLYAPDALIEDPVGPSPFDPQGEGNRGHERLAAFWDGTIATTERLDFIITASYAAGREVANTGRITAALAGSPPLITEGIYVYRIDEAGLICSLRAFWEFERAMASLGQGGS